MEPQESNKNFSEVAAEKPAKTPRCRKWIPIAVITLLLILSAACYYWESARYDKQIGDKNSQISRLENDKKDLQKKLSEAQAKANTEAQTSKPACKEPTDTAKENIRASITSGNTAALESYMAAKVLALLAASGGIGERTPTQAVSDIDSFLKNTSAEWDFNLPEATLSTYAAGDYKQYFPKNAVVGTSGKLAISFSFDCDGKVSTVFMANDTGLL